MSNDQGLLKAGQKAFETLKSAGNQPDLSSWARRESRRIFSGGLYGHPNLLLGQVHQRRFLCD